MNKLFIISGPSGAGKSSIARSVMENEIVSVTTREPRPNEVEGKDYCFISKEKFDQIYNDNGFAEFTGYYGTANYAITLDELHAKLAKEDAFVVVDVIGKQQLEILWENTLSIFIFAPDTEIAEKRMRERGDSEENIAKRLKTYEEEIGNFPLYDVLLDNTGNFEDAVEGFKLIIGGELK